MGPRAIAIAEEKARDRGLAARFLAWDALELGSLGERFNTVLDRGLVLQRAAAAWRATLTRA